MTVTVKSESNLGKVVSIQILPVKPVGQGSIEAQYSGANANTRGWGVYMRHANGMAKHHEDFDNEAAAARTVLALCQEHRVPVEQYPWMDSINLPFRYQHAQFLVAETEPNLTRIVVWNNDFDSELYEAVGSPDVRYSKKDFLFRPATVQEAREALNLVKAKAVNQEQNKARASQPLYQREAFEKFALTQPFIKDVQRYADDHPIKEYAGNYGHYDTKNAKVMFDAGVQWVTKLIANRDPDYVPFEHDELRVVVSGYTACGKSALSGLLFEKLVELGIGSVVWEQGQYEQNRQTDPWEDELKKFNPSIKIIERNIPRHPLDFGTMEIRPEGIGSVLPQKLKDSLNRWATTSDFDGRYFEPHLAGKEYTTKDGDTLSDICQRAYANPQFWGCIIWRNQEGFKKLGVHDGATIMPAGIVIWIPAKEDVIAALAEIHNVIMKNPKPEVHPGPDGDQQ